MTSFPSPAAGVYYHYTTRHAAQDISISGEIRPGRDGLIYLTDVLYRLGWQATDYLALPSSRAEIALAIPVQSLMDVEYWGVVPIFPSSTGEVFRRGGAHQWVVSKVVKIPVYPWSWLPLEMP
jgi:hypothetical protein